MPHIFTPRHIRQANRKLGNQIKEEMRSNLMYLIKPRPKFIPRTVWVWLLRRFLNLP